MLIFALASVLVAPAPVAGRNALRTEQPSVECGGLQRPLDRRYRSLSGDIFTRMALGKHVVTVFQGTSVTLLETFASDGRYIQAGARSSYEGSYRSVSNCIISVTALGVQHRMIFIDPETRQIYEIADFTPYFDASARSRMIHITIQ
jgi:hypothetical protein